MLYFYLSTNKRDWVLDPFLGSGTSIISALKNGRKGVGAEINQKYVDIACERIKQLRKGSLKTRPMNTPISDPRKWIENAHLTNDNHQTNWSDCSQVLDSFLQV